MTGMPVSGCGNGEQMCDPRGLGGVLQAASASGVPMAASRGGLTISASRTPPPRHAADGVVLPQDSSWPQCGPARRGRADSRTHLSCFRTSLFPLRQGNHPGRVFKIPTLRPCHRLMKSGWRWASVQAQVISLGRQSGSLRGHRPAARPASPVSCEVLGSACKHGFSKTTYEPSPHDLAYAIR